MSYKHITKIQKGEKFFTQLLYFFPWVSLPFIFVSFNNNILFWVPWGSWVGYLHAESVQGCTSRSTAVRECKKGFGQRGKLKWQGRLPLFPDPLKAGSGLQTCTSSRQTAWVFLPSWTSAVLMAYDPCNHTGPPHSEEPHVLV